MTEFLTKRERTKCRDEMQEYLINIILSLTQKLLKKSINRLEHRLELV